MSKFWDNLKKGNVEFTIPDSWSMKKAGWVIVGLLLFSVAFGILSIVENNFLLVSLCIFSALSKFIRDIKNRRKIGCLWEKKIKSKWIKYWDKRKLRKKER